MAPRDVFLSLVSVADKGDVTGSGVSDGKDRNEEEVEKDGDGRPQKKLAKKTVVKVASKSKKKKQREIVTTECRNAVWTKSNRSHSKKDPRRLSPPRCKNGTGNTLR